MDSKYIERPYHVVMFVSRNKDNAGLGVYFKQRTKTFLTQKNPDELEDDFSDFCECGIDGETSRFYISANSRKHNVVIKSLQHYLIDKPDTNLADIERLIASLAMKKGTAQTKKFLFDYDDDPVSIGVFLNDVKQAIGDESLIKLQKTVSGYAIVTEHGFDTRELLNKWDKVELKRDGMLFVKADQKY